MLRQVLTATAVVALLAGCGGSDDQSGSGTDGGDEQSTSPTPTTPAMTAYDPPKAFEAEVAYPQPRSPKNNQYTTKAGIVGQTALIADLNGITGRNVIGLSSWQLLSSQEPTTVTLGLTTPMAVTLDGKEVIAMAYVQRVQGSGTQKAKGQVLFQWIDPAEGKAVKTVTYDLSAALGPDAGGDEVVDQAYDAATGQVAVGVSPDSDTVGRKAGTFMVYADPSTQRGSFVPFLQPAGVLNGTVVGTHGTDGEGVTKRSIAVVDGATGKITKDTPVPMNYLGVAGAGVKHAYLNGRRWIKTGRYTGRTDSTLYVVDLAGGAVKELKAVPPAGATDQYYAQYTCWSDQAAAVVCTSSDDQQHSEILGIDDNTGQKVWGYDSQTANRIVPDITAAYHGVVYAQAEQLPVLLNAATGEDLPAPSPTTTPTGGNSPTDGASPGDPGSTPTDGASPSSGDFGGEDGLADYNGKQRSPAMVSPYGGVYLQAPTGTSTRADTILVVLKATA